MGAGQSSEEDDAGLNLAQVSTCWWDLFSVCMQPVVPLTAGPTMTNARSISQETRKALPVRNPFLIKFDDTLLKPDDRGQTQINLRYTAETGVKAIIYYHACPTGVNHLSDCSTPDSVPADWEPRAMRDLDEGTDVETSLSLGDLGSVEEREFEILLIKVSALAANSQWTQWYYLRFEPFRSGGAGAYALTQWEEKMQIGKKVYSIMKIYSTKDEQQATPATCLICSTETCNTMVLPCRHLCLCTECATAIRLRDQKCPICRSVINSLLQIDAGRNSASMDDLHVNEIDEDKGQQPEAPQEETVQDQ